MLLVARRSDTWPNMPLKKKQSTRANNIASTTCKVLMEPAPCPSPLLTLPLPTSTVPNAGTA